jgi:hypothetical protein
VLFDPTASLRETEGYGFVGEANGTKVDTINSLGECSIREGAHTDTVYTNSFGQKSSSNSALYSVEFRIPAPNS